MGKKSPPPPDYKPVAAASQESAKLGLELGREQLAENRRQFEETQQISRPIINSQARLQDQAYEQGTSNFETFRNEGRPLQELLRDEAQDIKNPNSTRLEEEAANDAISDSRAGTTQQQNQFFRQGARYGYSPQQLATKGGTANALNAATQVSAANAGRSGASDKYYGRLGDVFNTYAGLGSSAPAFYQAGTQAGSSAIANRNQTAATYLNGINAGNSTIQTGQSQRLGGLGSVLSNQTSASNSASASNGAATGAAIGGVVTIAAAFI